MVPRTSTVCQRLTIILYVIFADWRVSKCPSKLDQHRTLFEVHLDIVVMGTMSSSNLVDAVGFEPTCNYERIYSPSPSASRSHIHILKHTLQLRCLLVKGVENVYIKTNY